MRHLVCSAPNVNPFLPSLPTSKVAHPVQSVQFALSNTCLVISQLAAPIFTFLQCSFSVILAQRPVCPTICGYDHLNYGSIANNYLVFVLYIALVADLGFRFVGGHFSGILITPMSYSPFSGFFSVLSSQEKVLPVSMRPTHQLSIIRTDIHFIPALFSSSTGNLAVFFIH